MIHINKIKDIPIEKVYHYEKPSYNKAVAFDLQSGIYTDTQDNNVKIQILSSEGEKVNIELICTNLTNNKSVRLKIDTLAPDMTWMIDGIINNLKYKENL
ncbi:MAG TPA: hypothetical protein DCX45_03665 [Acinetobacter junii]|nr:hypothetical protein [Acinetobacter junii]